MLIILLFIKGCQWINVFHWSSQLLIQSFTRFRENTKTEIPITFKHEWRDSFMTSITKMQSLKACTFQYLKSGMPKTFTPTILPRISSLIWCWNLFFDWWTVNSIYLRYTGEKNWTYSFRTWKGCLKLLIFYKN